MGCGGSKSPDATDPSASEIDPTADAPPVSRNPGVTSASEVTVSVSDPGSSASGGAPATEWPSVAGAAGDSFNKGSSGQAKRSLDGLLHAAVIGGLTALIGAGVLSGVNQ